MVPPAMYSVLMGLLALVSVTGAGLVLLSLLLGLLVPHLWAMIWSDSALGRWWLPIGSALIGTMVVIIAMVSMRLDADHPRLFQLIYGLDTQTGEAFWASIEAPEYSQEWTEQFFSEKATNGPLPQFFGGDRPQFKVDQAPLAPLSLPEIEVLENTREGDIRSIRLSIVSTGGATQVRFYIDPPAEVLSVTINGEPFPVAENPPD